RLTATPEMNLAPLLHWNPRPPDTGGRSPSGCVHVGAVWPGRQRQVPDGHRHRRDAVGGVPGALRGAHGADPDRHHPRAGLEGLALLLAARAVRVTSAHAVRNLVALSHP